MEVQILEGTLEEVQRQLSALPLTPETHLHVVVTEAETSSSTEEAFFANAPRRNGLILVPTKDSERQVTVELVKALSED